MWRSVVVLVAVAALGAACTAGTDAGAPPDAAGEACPPGTSPDAAGDADQERPRLVLGTSAAIDDESAQVVVLPAEGLQTWVLDVCTNSWQRGADRPAQTGTTWQVAVDDPGTDVVLAFDVHDPATAPVWAYSVEDDTWTARPAGGGTGPLPAEEVEFGGEMISGFFFGGVALDPDDSVVYVHQRGQLYALDLAADRWQRLAVEGEGPPTDAPYTLLAFDSRQRLLVLAVLGWEDAATLPPAQTWLFDVDAGTWSRAAQGPPEIGVGWGQLGREMTYEPVSDRVVAIGDGRVAVLDVGAQEWTLASTDDWGVEEWDEAGRWPRPRGPQSRTNASLVADPLNGRVLVLGGDYWDAGPGQTAEGGWTSGSEVVAYDVAANSWVELVPPQE